MQFRVTVPPGIKGGQVVTVNAAGAQYSVRVPKQVETGDSFLFTLTEEQIAAATKELLEGKPVSLTEPVLFHDYTDLAMALCLGFIIGFCIVIGFILGVLFVTEPLPLSPPR